MPVLTFDSQDAVPDVLRDLAVEENGKWVASVVPESEIAGLKDNNKRILTEKKKRDEELAGIRGILGDRKPEDIAAILKAHETAEEQRQREAGNLDKIIEKRVNETKAEYERRLAELEPYKQKYEDRELDLAIREAAASAKIIPGDMKAVVKMVKGDRIRLDVKSGKPVVVDEDGDPTGITLEKFFSETFKQEYPKFYEGTVGSGGGATPGSPSIGRDGAVVISAADARDAGVYRRAKEEAAKRGVPLKIDG